jgi:PAS domain S-box-containing protein
MTNAPPRHTLQQVVLAELGLRAIGGAEPGDLAAYAARAAAEALGAPLAAVLDREGDALVLVAGDGWPDGLLGQPLLTARNAHAAEALASGEPVLLAAPVPAALAAEGVASGLAVRLGGAGEPAGLFAVYDRKARDFDAEAHAFVAAIAAILAGARERARTEQALRESEVQFRRLTDSAPVLIWVNGLDGCEFVNRPYFDFLGLGEVDVRGYDWARFIHPDDRDGYLNAYRDAMAREERFEAQFRFRRHDGEYRWMLSVGVPRRSASGALLGYTGSTLDVTDLKQAEASLRESEARARAVLETTVDGVITISTAGIIESFNDAAERIFGYRADEVIGKNVNVLMPEPYHSEHDGYIRAYRETGQRRIIGIGREVVGRRKDGSTFPMDLAVSEVQLPGRKIYTGFIRDISARRELEQEVLRIAEEERRRIGQDLHDGLGQMLTGTTLIARGLARRLHAEESESADAADEVVRLVKEADTFARALARGLVPVEMEAGGLDAVLERLCANAERLFGIACSFEALGDKETDRYLPEVAPNHLFRIAQEAVSNAVRHGQARHVAISLARAPDRFRLVVHDDGRGFPGLVRSAGADRLDEHTLEAPSHDGPTRPGTEAPLGGPSGGPSGGAAPTVRSQDNRGMGVRIMHYRARILGGALEIRSSSEGGTLVTCTVPTRRPLASETVPADEDTHPRR